MSTKKLLVVVADPVLRELVTVTVQSEAYQVIQAADGAEARELIRRERPDLVLLDVMMPELSGLDVRDRIHEDPELKDTLVVMLTAGDRPEDREASLSGGVRAYLTKPFSPLQLMELVEEVMGLGMGTPLPGGTVPPPA